MVDALATPSCRDFLLSDADRAFRAQVHEVLARELQPRAGAIENDGDWAALRDALRAVGQNGLLKLMFAELYEGPVAEPGLRHATLLSEEAASINYAFETTLASAISAAHTLHRYGRPAVKEGYLAGLLDASRIGAICVTEPGAGSDTSRLRTRVCCDEAHGEWVVDGTKRYISNASVADVYIVYGVEGLDGLARRRLNVVAVPADCRGIAFPARYTFMGRRGCMVGEVRFDNCRVSADHLLDQPGAGMRVMRSMFNFERVILAGASLGVARSAFELALEHARTRMAFGSLLATKQLTWNRLAEMRWRLDAAELLTYRAALLYDAGTSDKELAQSAAMAKLVASETATYCADAAVQILGGDGLTKQYGRCEQIYRDARALPIVGGTSEMARYLIASADLPNVRLDL
jgi:alkylation response protein AidB-like acyl-CoA dehydrogenase